MPSGTLRRAVFHYKSSLQEFLELSYSVRYSDRVEREMKYLSPGGACQRILKTFYFWYGICITGMEFIHLDSLLMRFRARIPYQKTPDVEKHKPARARASPPQSVSARFGMELVSLVWDSYSWTHYLLYFVYQFHTKTDHFGPEHWF